MRWVFDLDNTLVRTQRAHLEAYRSIGVEPPPDFHVRPWQEWCTVEAHALKGHLLPSYMEKYAERLPLADILPALGERARIMTNASHASVAAVLAVFPDLGQYWRTTGASPEQKLGLLLAWQGESSSPGIYLDDNSALVARVRSETRWQALDTSGF